MPILISAMPLGDFKQTAKANAIAGASAGVALGLIQGIMAAHESPLRDRYDVAAEALTQVGTGAALGALAGTTAALAGVSVASVAGRGILAFAVPLIASTVATGIAHAPVERAVHAWSEDIVGGLKRTLERRAVASTTSGPSRVFTRISAFV